MKKNSKNDSRVGSGPIPKDPPRLDDYLKSDAGEKKINGKGGIGKTVGKVVSASKPSKPVEARGKDVKKSLVSPVKKKEAGGAKLSTHEPKERKGWWVFVGLLVLLVVLLLRFLFFSQFSWTGRSYEPSSVAEAEEVEVAEKVEAEDITVARFSDLGMFLIDGDLLVENFKVQGAEMSYVCSTGYGVFISMDPGSINSHSTGDLGVVAYVECSKGSTVKLQTPHWSTSALHNQIHLVELTEGVSTKKAVEILKTFKVDEGKELAMFIDKEGKVTKY